MSQVTLADLPGLAPRRGWLVHSPPGSRWVEGPQRRHGGRRHALGGAAAGRDVGSRSLPRAHSSVSSALPRGRLPKPSISRLGALILPASSQSPRPPRISWVSVSLWAQPLSQEEGGAL